MSEFENQKGNVASAIKQTARAAKIVAGFGLLGVGIAMLALPGPGWLTIAAGLAMLAGEFLWARRLMDRLKGVATHLGQRVKRQEQSWRRK